MANKSKKELQEELRSLGVDHVPSNWPINKLKEEIKNIKADKNHKPVHSYKDTKDEEQAPTAITTNSLNAGPEEAVVRDLDESIADNATSDKTLEELGNEPIKPEEEITLRRSSEVKNDPPPEIEGQEGKLLVFYDGEPATYKVGRYRFSREDPFEIVDREWWEKSGSKKKYLRGANKRELKNYYNS